MKKYLLVYCIVFIYYTISQLSIAEAQGTSPNLSFIFAPGLSFGPVGWIFMDDKSDREYHVNSMLSFSAGIQYGPVWKIDGAVFYSSLEVSFGNLKTKPCNIKPKSGILGEEYLANLEIDRIPAMFWMTITTDTKLSPFIRVGAGVSNTGFKEVYSYEVGPTVQFHKWAFTWGIGGGIGIKTYGNLELALYLDDWVTNSELVGKSHMSSKLNGPGTPFKLTVVGIKAIMKLKSFNE